MKRTDFETEKKIIEEIERKEITIIDTVRKIGVNPATISRWIDKSRNGNLVDRPSVRDRSQEKEAEKLKTTVRNLCFYTEQLKKRRI